jgi:hypothetical protein
LSLFILLLPLVFPGLIFLLQTLLDLFFKLVDLLFDLFFDLLFVLLSLLLLARIVVFDANGSCGVGLREWWALDALGVVCGVSNLLLLAFCPPITAFTVSFLSWERGGKGRQIFGKYGRRPND